MTDTHPSSLLSASPLSLQALFDATDPLSPQDERRLITELRRRRDIFAAEDAAKAAAGKRKPRAAGPSSPADMDKPLNETDLDDLV